MSSTKRILVTLATGKQGSHVVKGLAMRNEQSSSGSYPYEILAVTRNAQSSSAKALEALPGVTLLESEYDVKALFSKATAGGKKLYGVFSVQIFMGKQPNGLKGVEGERVQGIEMADEAAKAGVEHFIYTSVDLGGLEDTNVPHFESKRAIENHIKSKGASLPATILQPVAFMDNFTGKNDMTSKVINTTFTAGLYKPVKLIACRDIGLAAAKAFDEPQTYIGKTIPLATDEIDSAKLKSSYKQATGKDLPTTFGFMVNVLYMASPEMKLMMRFINSDGFTADITATRKLLPDALTLDQYMKTEL